MRVPHGDEERRIRAGFAAECGVNRGDAVGGEEGMRGDWLVGSPPPEEGAAAEVEGTRIEVSSHGIIGCARGETKGPDQGGEAGGAYTLISRGEAKSHSRAPGCQPADVLADEGFIGGPAVLKTEDRFGTSSSARVGVLDRGVKE